MRVRFGDGDPAVWRDVIGEWAELGVTDVALDTLSYGEGATTADLHREALERFAEAALR